MRPDKWHASKLLIIYRIIFISIRFSRPLQLVYKSNDPGIYAIRVVRAIYVIRVVYVIVCTNVNLEITFHNNLYSLH